MKKISTALFSTGLFLLMASAVCAQANWKDIGAGDIVSRDSVTREGYTLIFINKTPGFDTAIIQRLIGTFFTVYPREVRLYNKRAIRKVMLIMDPGYKGVAATAEGITRLSPEWFHVHPGDIDVITHEMMHIVQAYPDGSGPWWITEGIADYVRYTLGVDNAGAGWELPGYSPAQHYTNSYRVTARFFVWLEKAHPGIIKKLDAVMRSKTYRPAFWKAHTGKTIDECWQAYAKEPAI